jgi:PAS domain S-box-containing protein
MDDLSSPAQQYITSGKIVENALEDMTSEISMIKNALKVSEEKYRALVEATTTGVWKFHKEELEESRHRFKEIADLLPGIICELDMNFKVTYINQKGLATFGLTLDDFENGINAKEFFPPQFQSAFEKDLYNIFHGDYGNPVPYSLYHKNKSLVHVLMNTAPIYKSGLPVGIRACIIDISDRVLAEEKLRLSDERFRTIYDESPIGIAIFSVDGLQVDQNRAFKKMFNGYDLHNNNCGNSFFSTLSLNQEELKLLHDKNPVMHESTLQNIKNGILKIRHFEWHITPIGIEESGQPMYLAQVKDTTEQKAIQDAELRKERDATERAEALVAGLRRELREKTCFYNMVSRSPKMQELFEILPEVAQSAATVLICGESGTGKELVAQSLHELSSRKSKPFIAINCSALPDTLLESELFGYKSGAFTDAKKDKLGKFALAEGGTMFLDEIGEISTAMQVKLLRVLQERVFEPLGGTASVKANVRIVAATNKNLKEIVENGTFREDLYYRLNVISIKLPNLNERKCDIPILCEHFIERFNRRYDKSIKEVSKEAMELMLSYSFPGNIRELENVIEHAFIFCKESVVEAKHLPESLLNAMGNSTKVLASINNFEELEKMYLKSVLSECEGDKIKVAQRLGIHKATLFRKINKFGLK